MRKILLFIVLCCCISASAQRVDKPGEAYDYFCKISPGDKCFEVLLLGSNRILANEDGKAIKFDDITEVMTFLSKRGWIFVDSYGDEKSSRYGLRIIMRKTVTSDEQALEHLKFKE